jgi:hypothetical protein
MAETPSVDEIVEVYMGAINERDEAARERLLEAAVTDDFTFTGVIEQTQGREAFNQLLGEILGANPEGDGAAIARTTEVNAHHGWVRFGWALQSAGGGIVTTPEGEEMAGWYVGQLGSDGRLEHIIVFLGTGAEGSKSSEEEAHEKSEEQAGDEQEGPVTPTSSEEDQQQRSTTTLGDLTARRYFEAGDQG